MQLTTIALPTETHVELEPRDVLDERDEQILERLNLAASRPIGTRTSSGPIGTTYEAAEAWSKRAETLARTLYPTETFRFSGVEGTGGTQNKRVRIFHTDSLREV